MYVAELDGGEQSNWERDQMVGRHVYVTVMICIHAVQICPAVTIQLSQSDSAIGNSLSEILKCVATSNIANCTVEQVGNWNRLLFEH